MSMDTMCNSCNTALPTDSQTITCCGSQFVTTKSNMVVSGTVTAVDLKGEEITFSINAPPSNGSAIVDFAVGTWNYTPNSNFVGTDTFTIKATNTDCDSCTITIVVSVEAQAPCCTKLCPITILSSTTTSGYVKACDPQNESISFSVVAQPVNGTLELNTISGEWVYTADDNFIGKDSFSVRATNQSGLWCVVTQSICVVNFCAALSKTASTGTVCVGCTFNYIITASNTGSIKIENCVIKDELPPQLEVVMLQLNGTIINENLCTGIHTGCIEPYMETVLIVTVKVLSDSLSCPFTNGASGTFKTTLNPYEPPIELVQEAVDCIGILVQKPKLDIKLCVNKTTAAVGEMLTYSIMVKNNGNLPLTNVTIIDPLDAIIQLQAGSLMVNTISRPDENIASGVTLPTLDVNETASIVFIASIVSQGQGMVEDQVIGTFDYMGCVEHTLTSGTAVSNIINLVIKNPSLQIEKNVDQSLAILGDNLTYTITITNCGDVDALNAVFKDTLSPSVELLNHTFLLNGKILNNVNLEKGIYLGNIPVMDKVTIQYVVRVVSVNCEGFIENKAIVYFSYSTGLCSSIKKRSSKSVCTKTCLAISLFKQISLKSNLSVKPSKLGIEQINSVTGNAEITDFYIIETPISTSLEGQHMTGHKLIFHGFLSLEVEYTADDEEQTVYSENYLEPFSSFVILQPEFNSDSIVSIKAKVENIYFKQTTTCCFFTNTTMLVVVNAK